MPLRPALPRVADYSDRGLHEQRTHLQSLVQASPAGSIVAVGPEHSERAIKSALGRDGIQTRSSHPLLHPDHTRCIIDMHAANFAFPGQVSTVRLGPWAEQSRIAVIERISRLLGRVAVEDPQASAMLLALDFSR